MDNLGKNIMCLIATMFYALMPKFIEEGRLCWLKAPLYKLEKGNNKVFAYDDKELREQKKTRTDWIQVRAKGLGELSADDMRKSMLHPEKRHLEILKAKDIEAVGECLNLLMGPKVDSRREFLFENVDFSMLNR